MLRVSSSLHEQGASIHRAGVDQRHGDFVPLGPDDEQPEVTVELDGDSGQQSAPSEQAPSTEDEDAETVTLSRTAAAQISRDVADVPPPPPAFPDAVTMAAARTNEGDAIQTDLVNLWAMTCQDGQERGFPILWHEKSGAIWSGDTVLGPKRSKPGDRARIEIPMDDPRRGVWSAGTAHTHPPPSPGYRALTVGPSDIDRQNLGQKRPGIVVDFATTACKKNDFKTYVFGPNVRQDY